MSGWKKRGLCGIPITIADDKHRSGEEDGVVAHHFVVSEYWGVLKEHTGVDIPPTHPIQIKFVSLLMSCFYFAVLERCFIENRWVGS